MDTKDWELLCVMDKEQTTLGIATKLFLTQPAVSYRLQRMEQEFGTTLFLRSAKGIQLTSAGFRLRSFAEQIIEQERHIHGFVRSSKEQIEGSILIGSGAISSSKFLPAQIKAFSAQFPQIKITLSIHFNDELMRLMERGELLVSVVRGECNWNGPYYKVFEEPMVIIASKPITAQLLTSEPFIATNVNEALFDIVFEQLNGSIPAQHPHQIRVIHGTNHCLELVREGTGWSIVSATQAAGEPGIHTKTINTLRGAPCMHLTHLVYSQISEQFDAYRAYIEHFKNFFSNPFPKESPMSQAEVVFPEAKHKE